VRGYVSNQNKRLLLGVLIFSVWKNKVEWRMKKGENYLDTYLGGKETLN
jgi:hypothetical protein